MSGDPECFKGMFAWCEANRTKENLDFAYYLALSMADDLTRNKHKHKNNITIDTIRWAKRLKDEHADNVLNGRVIKRAHTFLREKA